LVFQGLQVSLCTPGVAKKTLNPETRRTQTRVPKSFCFRPTRRISGNAKRTRV